jgi:hypothetical protein
MGKSTKKGAPGETGTTPVAEDLALGSTEPRSTPARVPDAVDPMDATVDIPEPKSRQPIVAAQDNPVTPSDREKPDDDSDEGSTMDLPPGGSVEDYSGIGFLRSSPGLGGSQSPSQSGVFPVASWERYEFLQLLGRGGMGAVYKAKDLKIGRIVALKFVRGDDEHLIARFLQEARAQARIKHPCVCQVLEVGEVEGKPYIAMQFVDGMSLAQARQVLSLEEKVAVIRESAEALHAAHEAGIIHREAYVKSNVCSQVDH